MMSYKIVYEFEVNDNITALAIDRPIKEMHYNKYLIDGVEYEPVIFYDAPRGVAIKGKGSFVGKTLECV